MVGQKENGNWEKYLKFFKNYFKYF